MDSATTKGCQPTSAPGTQTTMASLYPIPAPAYSLEVESTRHIQHSYALHLDASTVLAGDVLTGHITLDLAQAQAEHLGSLKLELHGTSTTIIHPRGIGQVPTKSTKTFLKLAPLQPLWTSASAVKPSKVGTIPFRLCLPPDLPPSFSDGGRPREGTTMGVSAKIEYIIIVRGTRHGIFRTGRWLEKPISIVKPAASMGDVLSKTLLVARPWAGPWRVLQTEVTLSHGARAVAELSVPDLMAYPSDVPLPYQLRIITESALSSNTPHVVDELPEVPADPVHLKIQLIRRLDVETDREKAHVLSPRPLGGFGSPSSRASVRAKVAAPAFVPSSSDSISGTWQRAVCYDGTFIFADTPSFSSQAVSVSHLLHLHIPIPGTTVVLSADWDITISSGIEVTPPTFNFGTADPTAPSPLPEYTRFG